MPLLVKNGMIIRSRYRNISFTKSDHNEIDFDDNYDIIRVSYMEGTFNTEIGIPGIRVYQEQLLNVEGEFFMNYGEVTINGIKFYSKVHEVSITQVIVKDQVPSQIVYQEPSGLFIIIHESQVNMTAEEYLNLINDNDYVYAEQVSEFHVSNFTAVNFLLSNKKYYFNNIRPYSNEVIYTDEVIIIDGFLTYLETKYPRYKFMTRPTDKNETDPDTIEDTSPNEVIFYQTKLGHDKHNLNSRPLESDLYETYRNTLIEMDFEYVCDDTNSVMKFREDFIMQRAFSNDRNYKYQDNSGTEWDASVIWESTSSEEMPSVSNLNPEVAKLPLPAFKFRAEVLGIICRLRQSLSVITSALINNVISNQTISHRIEE